MVCWEWSTAVVHWEKSVGVGWEASVWVVAPLGFLGTVSGYRYWGCDITALGTRLNMGLKGLLFRMQGGPEEVDGGWEF